MPAMTKKRAKAKLDQFFIAYESAFGEPCELGVLSDTVLRAATEKVQAYIRSYLCDHNEKDMMFVLNEVLEVVEQKQKERMEEAHKQLKAAEEAAKAEQEKLHGQPDLKLTSPEEKPTKKTTKKTKRKTRRKHTKG